MKICRAYFLDPQLFDFGEIDDISSILDNARDIIFYSTISLAKNQLHLDLMSKKKENLFFFKEDLKSVFKYSFHMIPEIPVWSLKLLQQSLSSGERLIQENIFLGKDKLIKEDYESTWDFGRAIFQSNSFTNSLTYKSFFSRFSRPYIMKNKDLIENEDYFHSLIEFAEQAELISESEWSDYFMMASLEASETEDMKKISNKVRDAYRGNLDIYIDARRALIYYACSDIGHSKPQDLFKMVYFLYLDTQIEPMTLVTTSNFWAYELQYAPLLQNRVMHWDDFQREILKDEVKLG